MNPDQTNVRRLATSLFDGVPGGALQRLRPLICPFDQLAQGVPVGSRVLDVGCGSGLFLGLLAGLGRIDDATGFDSNGGAIQRALQMRQRLPPPARLEFERRDVADGWPEGLYDVVSVIDVMHHVPPKQLASLIATAAQ